jgi:2,3-dihydroxybenzoate decarboxylase
VDTYFRDYLADFPALRGAAWGFTIDTATQAIRLILSGVFEACPKLKIILGHMGESLPHALWRIDYGLARPGNKTIAFRELFCRHFWITTSGHFSTPALMCSLMEMGVDRILFSVDYPFVENVPGTRWMEHVPLSLEDREKILNGNATRLLRL